MRVEADLAAAVHLFGLAVQLRQRQLGRHVRVGDRKLELEVELVFEKLVHVPHLSRPSSARLVGLDREPLIAWQQSVAGHAMQVVGGAERRALLLVDPLILDERTILLLDAIDPLCDRGARAPVRVTRTADQAYSRPGSGHAPSPSRGHALEESIGSF